MHCFETATLCVKWGENANYLQMLCEILLPYPSWSAVVFVNAANVNGVLLQLAWFHCMSSVNYYDMVFNISSLGFAFDYEGLSELQKSTWPGNIVI